MAKHVCLVLAATLALLPVSALAASGNTATVSGQGNAQVVQPIVLTHTAGARIKFGRFTRGTGGTITVSPTAVASVGGDVGLVPGTTRTADRFAVTGDNSRSFSITAASGTVVRSGVSMTFVPIVSAASMTLSATGTATFTVGATLTVPGTVAVGTYTGTYTATVAYN